MIVCIVIYFLKMSAFQSIRTAAAYSLHRPRYPQILIEQACLNLPSTEQALDVACGSGQLTCAISKNFSKVLGIDRSQAQLNEAEKGAIKNTIERRYIDFKV